MVQSGQKWRAPSE